VFMFKFFSHDKCQMCSSDLRYASRVIGFRMGCSQGLRPLRNRSLLTNVCECNICGLVYVDPMPIPLYLQDHYSSESGKDYHGFGDWHEGWFAPQIASFKKLISREVVGAKALDVGCGSSHVVRSLLNSGFDAYGLEPSDVFFGEIITASPELKNRIVKSTIEDYIGKEASFDFITFGAVLEHLPYPGKALEHASKLLAGGGLIHIEVPNARWLVSDVIDFFYWISGLRLTTRTSPLHSPYHLYEFTEKSFTGLAERCGLEIVKCKSFVSNVPHFPAPIRLLLRWAMNWSGRYMQLEVWLRKAS
jgi:SAM-dependent methyltransferase